LKSTISEKPESKSKHAPIVELVTHPFDETKDIKEVETGIGKLQDVAQGIEMATGGFTKHARLNAVTGIACSPNVFVGTDKDGKEAQNTNAYVQATYGVTLENVPKAFSGWMKLRGTKPKAQKWSMLGKAMTKGEQIAGSIILGKKKANKQQKQLAGLCTLIVNQLLMLQRQLLEGQLTKHLLRPFFYKTKLSTVVSEFKSSDKANENLLKKGKKHIKGLLLKAAEVDESTWIFRGLQMGSYLDQVLAGTADPVFDAAKNPYSKELKDKQIGRSKGVGIVMEQRKWQQLTEFTEKPVIPPDMWMDYARLLYWHLRDIEGYAGAAKKVKELRPKVKLKSE